MVKAGPAFEALRLGGLVDFRFSVFFGLAFFLLLLLLLVDFVLAVSAELSSSAPDIPSSVRAWRRGGGGRERERERERER
jgi:Na+-transporting methylmalonyl-CoA/oxaloacetate decarboxylase gamma subunit